MRMITLGYEVKDRVSGFQGVAIGRHQYLQGCARISVQPPVDEKGELPESKVFDEPDLTVIGDGVTKGLDPAPVRQKTGGPHDHDVPDSRRY